MYAIKNEKRSIFVTEKLELFVFKIDLKENKKVNFNYIILLQINS